jgi:hypothetical protein
LKSSYNTEFVVLYSSVSIVRVIKLRRLRWVIHVTIEESNTYEILIGRPHGRNHVEKYGT